MTAISLVSLSGSADVPRGAGALGSRHLVLLGLPGAGKSTIGPLVAAKLERHSVDLDSEIERREGRSVAAIFASPGEAHFRSVERAVTAELFAPGGPPIVLSPGGGWIEDPANRGYLGGPAAAVYLRVSEEVALSRMGASVAVRPLLEGPDPRAKLRELLARRGPFYLQAEYTVSTELMSASEAASSIVALATAEIPD